jgi:FKBP-type peptidyl-prolyl cis-trans isomerase FklB
MSSEEAAYTIGINLGEQLRQYGVTDEVSADKILQGLNEGLAGKKGSPADQVRLQAFLRSVTEAASAKNAVTAKEYLAHNSGTPGVKTTASGLQYKIIAPGDLKAASPQPTDLVTVRYRGTLLDGSEFDSSYKRGISATFSTNSVIPGWQEALALMKPGAKWQLFIPPELAYGAASRHGIPGGSLLIFDLELQSFKAPPAPPKVAAQDPPAAATAPTLN